jgi:glutamyl-tRNA synthetase/glutamyl-Q tRNA(Asp) synthetase
MGAIISRFAPAPTGFLHLGHVVNALWVWQTADRVLLRIEDHDRQRSRPEFEAAIVEDLDWLGFVPDGPPVRQRERGDIYSQALESLKRQQLVYGCDCTRAEIARAGLKACATSATPRETIVAQPFPPPLAVQSGELRRGTPKREKREGGRAAEDELRYPGTCRDRGFVDAPGVGLRVRVEPSVERFVDLRHGPQEQRPSEQCGDLLIRDREGNWTYQFAVTVDDYVQGVTHVIRGDDLLASTGRQLQLARLLGRREPPLFLHHALIMKSATQKLSKSDGDTGVRDLRARGWTPAQVIARARELSERTERS